MFFPKQEIKKKEKNIVLKLQKKKKKSSLFVFNIYYQLNPNSQIISPFHKNLDFSISIKKIHLFNRENISYFLLQFTRQALRKFYPLRSIRHGRNFSRNNRHFHFLDGVGGGRWHVVVIVIVVGDTFTVESNRRREERVRWCGGVVMVPCEVFPDGPCLWGRRRDVLVWLCRSGVCRCKSWENGVLWSGKWRFGSSLCSSVSSLTYCMAYSSCVFSFLWSFLIF